MMEPARTITQTTQQTNQTNNAKHHKCTQSKQRYNDFFLYAAFTIIAIAAFAALAYTGHIHYSRIYVIGGECSVQVMTHDCQPIAGYCDNGTIQQFKQHVNDNYYPTWPYGPYDT